MPRLDAERAGRPGEESEESTMTDRRDTMFLFGKAKDGDADAMDLLQRMFWLDPTDRLSLEQVCAHPWMQIQ